MSNRAEFELPLVESQRPERADAARNRSALIEAALRLLDERGPEAITMDAVACAAGVGKGTLFRRFGDRASLFRALLDESERAFQDGFIRGPAPLGPGAPPHERLVAFGCEMLELIEARGELMIAAQAHDRVVRYGHPTYLAYRLHVSQLLREAGLEDRGEYLVDVLLGALDAGLVMYQRRLLGLPLTEIQAGWRRLVDTGLRCS
jgi:AcrR family transcriptional regulator